MATIANSELQMLTKPHFWKSALHTMIDLDISKIGTVPNSHQLSMLSFTFGKKEPPLHIYTRESRLGYSTVKYRIVVTCIQDEKVMICMRWDLAGWHIVNTHLELADAVCFTEKEPRQYWQNISTLLLHRLQVTCSQCQYTVQVK